MTVESLRIPQPIDDLTLIEEPPVFSAASPSLASDQPQYFRLFVRDLVVPFEIGVYSSEKGMRQAVRFCVDLWVDEARPHQSDQLQDTVSYEIVVKAVEALAEQGHINLVETLAERVAATCLTHSRIAKVRVQIEKLEILAGAGSVGVEIERYRAGHAALWGRMNR